MRDPSGGEVDAHGSYDGDDGARRPGLRSMLLVGIGGSLGTGLRVAVDQLVPRWHDLPFGLLTVNASGAFALGVLVGLLATATGRHHDLRLLLGVGLLGGFTTYSALATETLLLFDVGRPLAATTYAGISVLAGVLAAWAGMTVGRRRRRGHQDAP